MERIKSKTHIEHRKLDGDLNVKQNWLPSGEVIIGITSGASTPDKVVEDIIKVLVELKAPGLLFQSLPSLNFSSD